ncbi:hypothetical protein [Bacillus sp. BP-3]|uniref:hypothetical protein n=1 Tax=Bacillus sp. BP-3 TaxID=3022773 RepID=UPI00232F7417|nr:hypothetical protein [Bacillus sp. BP-3]MDC2865112.1 hypothetical protein [Bacillus sp. BP-3]
MNTVMWCLGLTGVCIMAYYKGRKDMTMKDFAIACTGCLLVVILLCYLGFTNQI